MAGKRIPVIRRIEKDLIDIDGTFYPVDEIKPQMVLERDEQWERVPSIGEPIIHFAHKIARRRIPDNANAYEIVGNGEERDRGFTWRFNQKVRYYYIDLEEYNRLYKETLSQFKCKPSDENSDVGDNPVALACRRWRRLMELGED